MIHFTKRLLPSNVAKSENMYEGILHIQVSPILFYDYFGKNAQNALFIKKSTLSTISNYTQLSSLLYSKHGKSFLLQLLLVIILLMFANYPTHIILPEILLHYVLSPCPHPHNPSCINCFG